ncbi:MAG: hypothetical protein ACYDDF_12905 [Thermoplasmatota archaeon]
MATTIRLEDAVKRDLDRLQADFLKERGERLSHSALLARLLEYARRHEAALLEEDAPATPSRDQMESFFRTLPSVRSPVRARDAKASLYEERP